MSSDALCLGAKLEGDLTIAPSSTAPANPSASTGCSFGLGLRADNLAPAVEKSQGRRTVNSPSSFVELFSLANDALRAWMVYIRVHSGTNPLVRVTYATTGQVSIPVQGLLVLEPPKTPDETITALEIQGTNLVFEWAALGADS